MIFSSSKDLNITIKTGQLTQSDAVAYPSGLDNGVCPDSHPKRFITVFYEVTWSVDDFKDMWYGDKQPFVFSTG